MSMPRRSQLVDLLGAARRGSTTTPLPITQSCPGTGSPTGQVELEHLAVADDRVAGVVAALVADDHVGPLGEQVDDLALALVAPLGADDHHPAWLAVCRP